jgi:hypothetical protein
MMSAWQSIETAPQDGSWLLVFDPQGVEDKEGLAEWEGPPPRLRVFMAHWEEKEWIACFGEVDGWGCPSGGYDSWISGLIVKPTLWMPLPDPPSPE